MAKNLRPKKQIKQVNQILKCAYLAAVGDAYLAEEECEELENIRSYVNRLLEARVAVEHYESTGDFDAALDIFPPDTIEKVVFGEGGGNSMFGGVPTFLFDLDEKRRPIKEVDEVIALVEHEATKIKDNYLQKIAVNVCLIVSSADGELAKGELISIINMCEMWGIDFDETINWLSTIVNPVLDGIPFSEDGDKKLFNIHGYQNSYVQAFICIFLTAYSDEKQTIEHLLGLASATDSLSELYNFTAVLDSYDFSAIALNTVVAEFADTKTIPLELKLKYAKKVASKVTDPYLQNVVANLALDAAKYDGEDEDKDAVVDVFLRVWGISRDEVAELEVG